jgi:leucyl-tRNA synthetase
MGNIMPMRAAAKQFGADAIRFVVVSGADLSSDTDFNRPAVDGVLSRVRFLQEAMEKYASIFPAVGPGGSTPMSKHAAKKDGAKHGAAGRWLLSRMHGRAAAAPAMYEAMQLRELSLELLYNTFNDLQRYLKREEKPQLREFFELWVPLIAPFMPHFAEEMWERLGKKHYAKDAPFVSVAALPAADKSKIDPALEAAEEYVLRVREDIGAILKLIKKEKPQKVELFVAAGWKRRLREIAARERKFDAAMKQAMADAEIKPHAKEAAKVLQQYVKAGALGEAPPEEFELEALKSGKKLLEGELGCPVSVAKEEGSGVPKAAAALPGKPSILVS